ncbi:hypothetical protein IC229_09635 [Spirosoma sp. BT702]|uniref:Lipoprotein n=1 Tax=Spirosoma profusum TaxID=2771354 RepID=A0A926XVA3_9BACT|nr:hypothetical protein [Spirosoma profusum]MBD2700899.1 hypothetical protein [Spirosoma profusum]
MKQIYCLFIFAISFTTLQSCNNRKQTENQSPDSSNVATDSAPATSPEVPISPRLAELGLTADSDWRGISLGDDFSKVKATEKGESFESDAKHVGYTLELKELETVDMLYYQAGQKVSAIDVDLFLNSREAVTEFQKDLTTYFTARYGTPKSDKNGNSWSSSGTFVTLKDVSKGKDFGLKINMLPSSGA